MNNAKRMSQEFCKISRPLFPQGFFVAKIARGIAPHAGQAFSVSYDPDSGLIRLAPLACLVKGGFGLLLGGKIEAAIRAVKAGGQRAGQFG